MSTVIDMHKSLFCPFRQSPMKWDSFVDRKTIYRPSSLTLIASNWWTGPVAWASKITFKHSFIFIMYYYFALLIYVVVVAAKHTLHVEAALNPFPFSKFQMITRGSLSFSRIELHLHAESLIRTNQNDRTTIGTKIGWSLAREYLLAAEAPPHDIKTKQTKKTFNKRQLNAPVFSSVWFFFLLSCCCCCAFCFICIMITLLHLHIGKEAVSAEISSRILVIHIIYLKIADSTRALLFVINAIGFGFD